MCGSTNMPARLPRALTAATLLAALAAGTSLQASADSTAALTLAVQVHGRSKLTVSARVLRFEVTSPHTPAGAAIDFVAASRTRRDGEVVLSVEPQSWVNGPGGAADVEAEITFAGEGAGTLDGALAAATPVPAGRWIGSGQRAGRLTFSLRAGLQGVYLMPLSLVLSSP
jgi:hypothetical protein